MAKHTATFGTISHGTMRPEDLIPAFVDELRRLRGALPKRLANDVRAFNAQTVRGEEYGDECELINELMDALNDYAPPYAYFGSHPGDGSDYGFWLHEDFEQLMHEDDVLKVSDTSEVPSDYNGEVLHVNDHGNATFYFARNGTLREVWSAV